MYNYRQVKCPRCNHLFMWIENEDKPRRYSIYRRKGRDEMLLSTKCPKCNCKMVVAGDSLVGLYENDEKVEEIGIVEGTYII